MIPGISNATLSDVPELIKLINSAYRGDSAKKGWTHEADLLTGIRISDKELVKLIKRKDTFLLKYIEENFIVGCVLLEKQEDKLYIGMLTVSPGVQGKGVGKKLLEAAEIKARELDCNRTEMSVISVRHELIEWYKRKGYIDTGIKKPFPEEMQKSSTSSHQLEFIILEKYV